MTSMDDSMIDALLRGDDETAPAELRDAVAVMVRRDIRPADDRGEPSRRRFVGLSVAASIVLLIAGLAVLGTVADDQAPATGTTLLATSPSTTGATTTEPTSTISPTEADAAADRLRRLPGADPITVVAQPGVMWPVPGHLPDGYTLAWAVVDEFEGRVLRYFIPECDASEYSYSCEAEIRIGVSDRVEDRSELQQQVPLTPDGDVWVWGPPEVEPSDPLADFNDEIVACLTNPACIPDNLGFSVSRGIGDSQVDVTGVGFDMGTLTEIALSIRLVDETELPWPPQRLQDDDIGPLVASMSDGIELHANFNGRSFRVTPTGGDRDWNYPWVPLTSPTQPNDPVWGGYDSARGKVLYGMVHPDVAELVFEFDTGDDPLTVVPGDESGIFRHQFFITEIPPGALGMWRPPPSGITMYALDADGDELARYQITDGGFGKLTTDSEEPDAEIDASVRGTEDVRASAVDSPVPGTEDTRTSGADSSLPEIDVGLPVDDHQDDQPPEPSPEAGVIIYGDGEISCPDHRADDLSRPVGTVVYQPEPDAIRIVITLTDAAPNVSYGVALWRDDSCAGGWLFRESDEFMRTNGDGAGQLDVVFAGMASGTYRLNVNLVAEDPYEDPRHREMGTAQFTQVVVP